MITLRMLRWGGYSGLSWWAQRNHEGPYKKEVGERVKDTERDMTVKEERENEREQKMLCCWL